MRHVRISFIIIWLGLAFGTYHVYATYNSARKGIDFSDLLSEWLRRGFDCRCRYRCPTSFITLIAFHFSEARIACSLCSQNIYSPRVGAEFVFFFRTFLFVLATFLHFTFCLLFCFFVFCLFCFLLLCCTLFAVHHHYPLARTHSLTLTRAFTPYFTSKVQIAHTISFALVSAAVVVACSASRFAPAFSWLFFSEKSTTTRYNVWPRSEAEGPACETARLRKGVGEKRHPKFTNRRRWHRLWPAHRTCAVAWAATPPQVTHFSAPSVVDEVDFPTFPPALTLRPCRAYYLHGTSV